jgi:hypothetical protein
MYEFETARCLRPAPIPSSLPIAVEVLLVFTTFPEDGDVITDIFVVISSVESPGFFGAVALVNGGGVGVELVKGRPSKLDLRFMEGFRARPGYVGTPPLSPPYSTSAVEAIGVLVVGAQFNVDGVVTGEDAVPQAQSPVQDGGNPNRCNRLPFRGFMEGCLTPCPTNSMATSASHETTEKNAT